MVVITIDMDMNTDFENALRAAFEAPVDAHGDPFSVEKPVNTNTNVTTKTSKKRVREMEKDKTKETTSFLDAAPVETKSFSEKKPKIMTSGSSGSGKQPVDFSRQDKIFKMCLGYIDAFPDVCQPPNHFAPNLPPDELQFILDGFQRKVQSHNELEMMRTGLITGAAVVENVMNFIPGQPVNLTGLSNNFAVSISRFDACLKEISIKYASTCSFSPEQMLLLIGLQICIHTHEVNSKTRVEIAKPSE